MPTNITLICTYCKKSFLRSLRQIAANKCKKVKNSFCSTQCRTNYSNKEILIKCDWCNKEFYKTPSQLSPHNFCSSSCSATYQNTHKITGTRISKLELYCQKELNKLYPTLEIYFNQKEAINSELDIYIPCLNLAFELNGIFHYEPIYGEEKLSQIQNNDNRKFQACLEKNIELVIIDTSQLKYFKLDNAKKYLEIITNIIDKKWLRGQASILRPSH